MRADSNLLRWMIVCAVAGLAFGGLVLPLWRTSFPSPPPRLTLEITFPHGVANRCEPLVTTGRHDDGDFFAVRYLDAETGVLVYDVWGVGGPVSRPFPLQPGVRRTLELEMPTLATVPSVKSHERRPLRVTLDRAVLLDEPVFFHRREPAEIFFARNPIGGTLAEADFGGQLALENGRVLRGGPECLFGGSARLAWILRARTFPLLLRAIASLALGLAAAWTLTRFLPALATRVLSRVELRQRPATVFPRQTRPPHRWFVGAALICTLAFAAVLTNGTFRFLVPDEFGDFYDYQAASLLQGRLDLPAAARTSESFIFEGRIYLYFGPTPALLRLPFAATGIAFGRLSRCYMLGYYVAVLGAIYAALIHAARIAGGPDNWPRPWTTVLLVLGGGLGSTLFFLSSRTYVFHEAILCGAAFAIWSGYCSLRYLAAPDRRWWIGALVGGILAVHARPPTGLFALAMLGWAAAVQLGKSVITRRASQDTTASAQTVPPPAPIRAPLIIGLLSIAGVLSFNGLSYLKFKTFDGCPLRYHVEYTPARLAAFEGRNFHLGNIGFTFDTYFWRARLGVRRSFPYFHFTRETERGGSPLYPRARFDLAEPVISMPYTMPVLLALALAGGGFAFARWPEARVPLGVVVAGAAPMVAALLTAIAVSERYKADFCPIFILAGAFGLQALDLFPARRRGIAASVLALLTATSVVITLLVTIYYQGELVWGVPPADRERYTQLRTAVDAVFGTGR